MELYNYFKYINFIWSNILYFNKDSNTNKDIKIDEGLKQLIQQVSLENNTSNKIFLKLTILCYL